MPFRTARSPQDLHSRNWKEYFGRFGVTEISQQRTGQEPPQTPSNCAAGKGALKSDPNHGFDDSLEHGQSDLPAKHFRFTLEPSNVMLQVWLSGPYEAKYGPSVQGMLQQFATFNEKTLVEVPSHLGREEASCLPRAASTAWSDLRGGKKTLRAVCSDSWS
ncbi:hypothetical protein PRZ48_004248 [Zasmidium cellare]|uniref:Uncharacterized protein n=1 Tax=Zasmidium cellare TaxID=395010 RepID=A0ABR0DWS1_ZASCE|nr:hypothetical protein PRZ48_015304 [Zasmidium cellare]KAK4494999.1 hypothetical protein PRZ48_014355 [Zasmidium cellare]KAK4503333.1 hypothetical protein PRZ48_004248 [Zasmidium cellare]